MAGACHRNNSSIGHKLLCSCALAGLTKKKPSRLSFRYNFPLQALSDGLVVAFLLLLLAP